MNKQHFSRSKFAMALTVFFGLLVSGTFAQAGQESEAGNLSTNRHTTCSDRSISGDFGFTAEGLLLNNPGLPAKAPFRSVGIAHFDGRGNLTWLERTVVNGTILNSDWTAASGIYSVNANCSGTATVNTPNSPVPLNLALVIVKQGREVRSVLESNAVITVFSKVN